MTLIICPNCKKNTPIGNYCVMCGETFEEYLVCDNCENYFPKYFSQCPSCNAQQTSMINEEFKTEEKRLVLKLKPFRISLYILFILSIYFVTQIVVVSLIVLVIPSNFQDNNSSINLISLLAIMISNLMFIFFLTKYNPFNIRMMKTETSRLKLGVQTLLLVILLISLSEILLQFLDDLLDFVNISSDLISPYDNYFIDPSVTALFTILVIFVGPLFEELIFRHHFISILSSNNESQIPVLVMNGLIFSFTHLPADLQYGSLRFTIEHLTIVFLLGIALGIIYLRFGLIFAVFFHSLWNIFSLMAQLSLTHTQLEPLLNLILLIGNLFLIIAPIVVFYKFFSNRKRELSKNDQIKLAFRISRLTILNFLVIIAYEALNALLLNNGQNILVFLVLLGIQVIFIILGFLVFEYDVKKRRTCIKNFFEP